MKLSLTHRKLPYWLITLIFSMVLGLIGLSYWLHTRRPTTVTPARTPELRLIKNWVQEHFVRHPEKRNFGVKQGRPRGQLGKKRAATNDEGRNLDVLKWNQNR
jgi:hypothetical protein